MFIKEIIKKNPTSAKTFTYHRLMEALRTARGPRQQIILNLGKLDIPRDEWKSLANRIEEIITGQQVLITPPHTLKAWPIIMPGCYDGKRCRVFRHRNNRTGRRLT